MTRILIVDDDLQVSEHLSTLLDEFGYQTLFLLEPEYLFQMLTSKTVDLMLLDIHMPSIDGLTLLKQLKQNPQYRQIPVIMLTGDTDEKKLAQCFESGAVDFINKPVRQIELKARLQSALSIQKHILKMEEINHFLKSTFEAMAEAVIQLDKTFQIQLISSKACRLLDVSEKKAIGSPATTWLGASISSFLGSFSLDDRQQEVQGNLATDLLLHNGTKIPVNVTFFPLQGERENRGWLLLLRDMRNEEQRLRKSFSSVSFGRMVSCDTKMNEIFELISRIAPSSAPVLIKGESGTGKELVAREIHERSRFAQGPFHAVNCGAISPNLMESEFFGHEKGAFTGANKMKKGRFELANGGTLFLDEVGDIPLEMQGKLLRVLQEQEFERVGGVHAIRVQLRIMAATNKDLSQMVQLGEFRDDLFYRLHVIPVTLPPLRDRLHDIPLLVQHFFNTLNPKEQRSVNTLSQKALSCFFLHDWPGNIRELYNVIEYAFAVSQDNIIHRQHLPGYLLTLLSHSESSPPAPRNEKELIEQALRQTNFSKPKAAGLLGIHRTTLYRKMKRLNIKI